MKKVLITGVTGQDGSYLAKKLVDDGFEVFGTIRRGSTPKIGRLQHQDIVDSIKLVPVEVTEFSNVFRTIREIKPNFIYNLAAQSFVQDSFLHPSWTSHVNYLGVLNFLEAINLIGLKTRFYQASTSEMYGEVLGDPQDEFTPFNPASPYAVSKCAAHHLVKNYREAYGINCSSGILFNHESELRGREFVTRKITYQLAEFTQGRVEPIQLGNLDSVRDWGYADDYVDAMILMASSNNPSDYVVATNKVTTVRNFFEMSAKFAGYNPVFEGSGSSEKCLDKKTGKVLSEVNDAFFRPKDVTYLRGDYSKINKELGWSPSTSFEAMVEKMVKFDLDIANGRIDYFGI
tara:strand:+ start:77 stop:1114 length:1038 start_codon:yes stop_codon:yes gene_type:complete